VSPQRGANETSEVTETSAVYWKGVVNSDDDIQQVRVHQRRSIQPTHAFHPGNRGIPSRQTEDGITNTHSCRCEATAELWGGYQTRNVATGRHASYLCQPRCSYDTWKVCKNSI
jgi:hypothetical protein